MSWSVDGKDPGLADLLIFGTEWVWLLAFLAFGSGFRNGEEAHHCRGQRLFLCA